MIGWPPSKSLSAPAYWMYYFPAPFLMSTVPAGLWIAPRVVGDCDDPGAHCREREGGLASHVSKPLDRDGRGRDGNPQVLKVLADEIGHAGSRRLLAALRAADGTIGFPVTTPRGDVAHVVGVRVHHPSHDLLVRSHVRRRDVDLGADKPDQLLHVAPREVLKLRRRQVPRVHDDAPLGAPVWQPHERALPALIQHVARAATSPRVTPSWKRTPPFEGPVDRLCWTLYPSNTVTLPSSRLTGRETAMHRRGYLVLSRVKYPPAEVDGIGGLVKLPARHAENVRIIQRWKQLPLTCGPVWPM